MPELNISPFVIYKHLSHNFFQNLTILALTCVLAACSAPSLAVPSAEPSLTPAISATPISDVVLLPTATTDTLPIPATLTPTPTAAPLGLFISPALPESFREAVKIPSGWTASDSADSAAVRLEIGSENVIGYWTLAIAAPFASIPDGLSGETLKKAWAGQETDLFKKSPILVSESTQALLAAWWGKPAQGAVMILPEDDLSGYAWEHRKEGICADPAYTLTLCTPAILPFDSLDTSWKLLTVDGVSPLHKDFNPQSYALNVPISLKTEGVSEAEIAQLNPEILRTAASNRDPTKLTIVDLTGVTAMGRATAWLMELYGVLYPGQDVRDLLRSADITHISNEVPFDPTCPRANPDEQSQIVFCSPPEFMALIEDVGADVIELDGDHMMDRGPDAFLYTLELYNKHNLPYYGGGANLAEGSRPVVFVHNGNKIAFVGCNAKPPGGYATAAENYPGAAHCFLDDVAKVVAELKADGYQVIVTFQHNERYLWTVAPEDRPDYLAMVDAGAQIVQGSQAHQPHNYELYKGALIHYGIGNLFFDQVNIVDIGGQHVADKAFINQHFFYNGHYLGAELFTLQFVDFARPRFMTPVERAAFLHLIFKAGGW